MVDATAARRAALELDVRVRRAELVEQSVHRERLGVGAGCALGTGTLDVVAVHVPLDERDVVVARAARRAESSTWSYASGRPRSRTSWWRPSTGS